MEETKKVEMKGSPKQVKWANDIIDKAISKAKINREKEIDLLVEIEASEKDIESVRNGAKIQSRFFEKIREYGDAALIIKKRFLLDSMSNNFCGDYLYEIIEMGDDIETNAVLCKDSRTAYRGRVENKVDDSVIDLIATELASRLMNSELR